MKKLFVIIIAFSLPLMAYTQKNSQWRGENRDGIYNEPELLKVWPEAGPQLLWHYEGLGDGYTSVAIANEKIYITGMPEEKLILYVLDLKGQLLKKKEVGKEVGKEVPRAGQYPGTRCTVCVNDGKLYIYNSLGTLVCLDEATLNEVWKKDVLTDFDGKNIMWGMTESPLIIGEKVFITPGGEKNNIVALNKNTGALIWSSAGLGKVSAYCSPQYIGDQSIPMIVTSFDKHIAAFNADTGEMLWSHPQESRNTIQPNTPLYFDGMILSTVGYRGGTWLYRLKDGGKAADLVWHNEEMDNEKGSAMKIGDYVYGGGHQNNYWFCLDLKTGETKYKVTDIGRANVIAANGLLYCYSEQKGEMFLVKPNPNELEIISKFTVTLGTNQHWAHPVIHQGVMYLRHGDALMAYKVK